MFDVSQWFDENFDDFIDTIDGIIEKIDKEYNRRRRPPVHDKIVKVQAWESKLEFRSQETSDNGFWDNMEDTFDYPAYLSNDAAIDAMAENLGDLANCYLDRGFDAEVSWRTNTVPQLIITWE